VRGRSDHERGVMTDESGRRGCFKNGCIGCAVVAGAGMLVLLVFAILGIVAASREERVEPVDIVRRVPSPEEILPPGAREPLLLPDEMPQIAEPGRVVLDVSWGKFSIRPGSPGDPIRLEGNYDAAGYELEESYDSYGERGWVYRVRLEPRGMPFVFNDEDTINHLRLTLPPDVPISLEGSIGLGESELDLGGLWLVDVDLEIGTGEHAIGFDEPLAAPLNRFRVDASIGELRIRSLGNASPAFVEMDHSIGEVTLDLRGEWRRDAEITARCGIGECGIRLPRDVGVELVRSQIFIGESELSALQSGPIHVPGAPTLRLSLSAKIGQLSVRR